jgi:hypothetical protein
MQPDLHPRLVLGSDGVSEFTFANLFLFRREYGYTLSYLKEEDRIVVSGSNDGSRFFLLPCGLPHFKTLARLFEDHDYLKNMPESICNEKRIELEKSGFVVQEDRDNFDYLYLRKDLANLPGRKLHKKRNLVNAFINNYDYKETFITPENRDDTLRVLEKWVEGREDRADYEPAREAIEHMDDLNLTGCLTYVDDHPAAYSLGEPLAKGRMFAIHFEKALGEYKGIYQFVNRSFASMLPRHYVYINREQDLGDPGLRQAKMSYRPSDFVKKYRVEWIKG